VNLAWPPAEDQGEDEDGHGDGDGDAPIGW